MGSLEKKVARLEEQNASLIRKLRKQESEISRLSVRESQLKAARLLPLLQKRLNTALSEREELECELTEARGREAKLLDEVTLLRTFVKLDENPELAKAARQCASDERIQEDLKALGEQLRTIAAERDELKKVAFLSCEEAEYYRDQWKAVIEEKQELEKYIKKLLAEQSPSPLVTKTTTTTTTTQHTTSTAASNTTADAVMTTANGVAVSHRSCSADAVEQCHFCKIRKNNEQPGLVDDVENLLQSLKEERARSEALQETVDALYEQQREKRQSCSHEQQPHSSPINTCGTGIAEQTEMDTLVQTLRQQLRFAEGECKLLKNRWKALKEQNQSLHERVAEQERAEASWHSKFYQQSGECERLKRELDYILRARSLASYNHTESTGDRPLKQQSDCT